MGTHMRQTLTKALALILRPLIRLWVKKGFSYNAFERVMRWVFVNGRRIDASRLNDVQLDEAEPTAFKMLIQPGAGLAWCGTYTPYIRVSPTLTMSVDRRPVEVKQDDLPKHIEFHTKPR